MSVCPPIHSPRIARTRIRLRALSLAARVLETMWALREFAAHRSADCSIEPAGRRQRQRGRRAATGRRPSRGPRWSRRRSGTAATTRVGEPEAASWLRARDRRCRSMCSGSCRTRRAGVKACKPAGEPRKCNHDRPGGSKQDGEREAYALSERSRARLGPCVLGWWRQSRRGLRAAAPKPPRGPR